MHDPTAVRLGDILRFNDELPEARARRDENLDLCDLLGLLLSGHSLVGGDARFALCMPRPGGLPHPFRIRR